MGRKRRCQGRDDSSSSDTSSGDDEMSAAATTPARRTSDSLAATEKQRNTRKREDKGIKKLLKELREDTSEMREQLKILSTETKDDTKEIRKDTKEIRKELKKLIESHNELRKLLFQINDSSGDDSAAPRSKSNQVQPPRYRLKFTCEVNDEIEKGQSIETNLGKMIRVAMYDDHDQIVETEPLASATVMLVVVNGEFNQHGNQYNWLIDDFRKSIRPPPGQGNSENRDANQSIQSIVSNCVFKLKGGVKSHTGATVLCNSSNKKVRLGVMVLSSSPTEERVLEGLSNPFFVRGHDRPTRKKQAPVGMQNQLLSIQNQPGEIISGVDPIAPAPNTVAPSTEPSISWVQALRLQNQFSPPITYGASMAQDGLWEALNGYVRDPNLTQHNYSTDNNGFPVPANGAQFDMDHTALPVQLVWDRPNVELRKSWNLLDQLMPLYSCQPKFYNCGLPAMHLMTEHLGSLTFIPKDVMQTTRPKKGVLIEPLEPDDSDEERSLKTKFHSKYRLRFVNKVCDEYYTWEKIKASDGGFLKVALFDENNTQITSGPLASAFVGVVVLHGDFNVDCQHYWTSQEFSRCVVLYPESGKLGGDRVLALADGEACLYDTFFQITSCHARTGKFKLGVVLASAQDERIQEGISEPFRVTEEFKKALPSGFRSRPTDQELILNYLCKRAASIPCPAPIIAEVDIYNFEPWDLPAKATFGKDEWYFFCPRGNRRTNRATGSGYWKDEGKVKIILDNTGEISGLRTCLVFYKRLQRKRTNWLMQEFSLAGSPNRSTIMGSSSTSSTRLQDWVLCRIFKRKKLLQPCTIKDEGGCDTPCVSFIPKTLDLDINELEEQEELVLQPREDFTSTNFEQVQEINKLEEQPLEGLVAQPHEEIDVPQGKPLCIDAPLSHHARSFTIVPPTKPPRDAPLSRRRRHTRVPPTMPPL